MLPLFETPSRRSATYIKQSLFGLLDSFIASTNVRVQERNRNTVLRSDGTAAESLFCTTGKPHCDDGTKKKDGWCVHDNGRKLM